MTRFLRYLAPNLVTSFALILGLLSMVAAHDGRFVDAGWLIIWAVLLDRLDGMTARALDATSRFGMQFDSFADFSNFGVAPAYLMYASLTTAPVLGFADGGGRTLLLVAAGVWVGGNVFRLARFNVQTAAEGRSSVYFGVPTPVAAGILVTSYLVMLKYAPAGFPLVGEGAFDEARVFGDLVIPLSMWRYIPGAMIVFAILMASNLPMASLGPVGGKAQTAVVLSLAAVGYLCGILRSFPDIMVWMPTIWLVGWVIWSQVSPKAREFKAPKWFR
jgi:CDP-diacylglycerol--serine O-phosphatidyltransferase